MNKRIRRGMAAIALANAVILNGLSGISIALPAVAREFGLTSTGLHWTAVGALLPTATFSLLSGRLGDAFGRRRIFLLGMAVFGLSSLLCAVSPNVELLLVGRFAQGCGGALALPLSLGNLSALVPGEQRGWAFGINTMIVAISGLIFPFLYGLIVDNIGWRWVFAFDIPAMAALMALALSSIPENLGKRPPHFDVLGCILLFVGLCSMVFALERRTNWGAADYLVRVPLGFGLVCLFIFARHELRRNFPLLELPLLRVRPVALTLLLLFEVVCVSIFVNFQLPVFLGHVQNMGPLASSAAVGAASIGMIVASPLAGRMADQGKGWHVISAGLMAGGVAIIGLCYALISGQYVIVLVSMTLLGFCPALVYTPASVLVVSALGSIRAGISTALTVEAKQLGATVGLASCQALFTIFESRRRRDLLDSSDFDNRYLDGVLYNAHSAPEISGHPGHYVNHAVDRAFTLSFTLVLVGLAAALIVSALIALFQLRGAKR
ncbi:MFS transporter [Streptomyces sp. NPDC008343]|uniref:MFS transporter n=1 Tax=Streptomyces sp. NPDC008343 TaxID=3364828 RepID=UPI0036E822DA